MNIEQKIYHLWLANNPAVYSRKFLQLVDYFGDPKSVFYAKSSVLESCSILSPKQAKSIKSRQNKKELKIAEELVFDESLKIIYYGEADYPDMLKEISDPPQVLYLKGKPINDLDCFAMVGTRNPTKYGVDIAKQLSRQLCDCGLNIVSGMAKGIDKYSHIGALGSKNGSTIAVLGAGIDNIYPPENAELYQELSENATIISEYPPGTKVNAYNFPVRNRIISGLSKGVIVVESGERSGTQITVRLALEQGREVFSVPGPINSEMSIGTNRLIKEGAKPVACVKDILEEFYELDKYVDYKKINTSSRNVFAAENKQDKKTTKKAKEITETKKEIITPNGLTDEERLLFDIIKVHSIHTDELARKADLPIKEVYVLLTMMEMSGYVKQLPGNMVEINN